MTAEYIQVSTTTGKKEDAERIAGAMVNLRLAACVQILGPIASTYWWKGRVETASEWLCVAKTTRRLYPELERAILEHHPYETPEIVATPIVDGSKAYLGWIKSEVSPT